MIDGPECVPPRIPAREHVFKYLVIGDSGVGKTAIVRRYVDGRFSSNYKVTIGADFSVKRIQWDSNTRLSVQLWDIAGHEKFNYATHVYYKYAVGCVIVFDITRHITFQSIKKWLNDVREKVVLEDGRDIPVILLANKWDIEEHCISEETISKYCNENNIVEWFPASAKLNKNISEAVICLTSAVIDQIDSEKLFEVRNEIKLEEVKAMDRSCCR